MSHLSALTRPSPNTVASLLLLKYASRSPASGPLRKKQRWEKTGGPVDPGQVCKGSTEGLEVALRWQREDRGF